MLTGYTLGFLDAAEDAFVTEHLTHCAQCEQDLIKLTDTLSALYEAAPPGLPFD